VAPYELVISPELLYLIGGKADSRLIENGRQVMLLGKRGIMGG